MESRMASGSDQEFNLTSAPLAVITVDLMLDNKDISKASL